MSERETHYMMTGSTYLQIENRETGHTSNLEIFGALVHIGRAASCEVQLQDQEVPEQVCRLERRGNRWFLVPLGPQGSVVFQDKPVQVRYPLQVNDTFQIGTLSLTLFAVNSADLNRQTAHPPVAKAGHDLSSPSAHLRSLPTLVPTGLHATNLTHPKENIFSEAQSEIQTQESTPFPRKITHSLDNFWTSRWKAVAASLPSLNTKSGSQPGISLPRVVDNASVPKSHERSRPEVGKREVPSVSRRANIATSGHIRGVDTMPYVIPSSLGQVTVAPHLRLDTHEAPRNERRLPGTMPPRHSSGGFASKGELEQPIAMNVSSLERVTSQRALVQHIRPFKRTAHQKLMQTPSLAETTLVNAVSLRQSSRRDSADSNDTAMSVSTALMGEELGQSWNFVCCPDTTAHASEQDTILHDTSISLENDACDMPSSRLNIDCLRSELEGSTGLALGARDSIRQQRSDGDRGRIQTTC